MLVLGRGGDDDMVLLRCSNWEEEEMLRTWLLHYSIRTVQRTVQQRLNAGLSNAPQLTNIDIS